MKINNYIYIFTLFLLMSCDNLFEKKTVFFKEIQPSFSSLNHDNILNNLWIRRKENLIVLHETFKLFDYSDLIHFILIDQEPIIYKDIYVNKKFENLIDSLILSYNQNIVNEKYYKEFWERRKLENNDSIVFQIIKDFKYSIKHKFSSQELALKANRSLVNDTLLQLLKIEYNRDSINVNLALQRFNTLKQLGCHQSAYNLLFENYEYENLNLNKDSLVKTLKQSKFESHAWIKDNIK